MKKAIVFISLMLLCGCKITSTRLGDAKHVSLTLGTKTVLQDMEYDPSTRKFRISGYTSENQEVKAIVDAAVSAAVKGALKGAAPILRFHNENRFI
jgi:hypothetical protein